MHTNDKLLTYPEPVVFVNERIREGAGFRITNDEG